MAVPVKESIPINFAGGLDLKSDPWQVGPANFLKLENSVFTTGGRLTKRNGYKTLGKSVNPVTLTYSAVPATISSARKVFSFKDELLLNDAFNLYSYDAANDAWNYKGRSTMVSLSTTPIVQGADTWLEADSSIDSATGIKVFAYAGANGVYYSIQDAVTGQFLVNKAKFGLNYTNPRCLSIAGKSWIFAVNSADHNIYYLPIVGQTPSALPPVSLISDLSATQSFYDIDVDSYSGGIYIAYNTNAGGIKVSAISNSLVVGNTINFAGTVATKGLSWFGDGSNIWVCYNDGFHTRAAIVNNAVAVTVLAPTDIALAGSCNNVTGVWVPTEGAAVIFYDFIIKSGSFTTRSEIRFCRVTVGGVASASAIFAGSVALSSKAVLIGGIPHVLGAFSVASLDGSINYSSIQPTVFLLNLYNIASTTEVAANIAGKVSPSEASPIAPAGSRLPSWHIYAGKYEVTSLQNSNYAFETTPYDPTYSPIGVINCVFDFSLSNPDVQALGNNAELAAASLLSYDGSTIAEQNFHIYPNTVGASISNAGGSMGLSAGTSTYGYIYVYEWIDNFGQVNRSFPSPVLTPLVPTKTYTFPAGTTTGSVTLSVPALRLTNKVASQVKINIYRTLANGSVYFLLGTYTTVTGTYGTVTNDASIDFISYVDTQPDSEIQGNLQLYTTGALGYYAPPALNALTSYKNRLMAIESENPYQIAYSNAVLQNTAVQFVPEFVQNIGTVGGPITTVANMDDKLIIFKSGATTGPAIWYMTGQGPAQSGANNDFTDPLPISVDAGCVDRASVVLTPVGLMFKSLKGIYLLDRGLQVSYIGAPVETYNQYSVVSAQLIPNTTQVRLLLSNGVMLMYDYFYQRWGTFTGLAGISDCIFQGKHTLVSSSGQVYQENAGSYVDGTNPVLMSFLTSWIKLAGLQGYQRSYFFYFLANYLSPHKLSLSVAYDFSPTPSQTNVITPDANTYLENWRVFLAQQRCQSFQLGMQEVYAGTPGPGLTMTGLNLIAGVKSKFIPMPNVSSTG